MRRREGRENVDSHLAFMATVASHISQSPGPVRCALAVLLEAFPDCFQDGAAVSIMPHFFAPGLRLLDRPMSWDEWATMARGGAETGRHAIAARSMASDTPEIAVEAKMAICDVSHWGKACATGWVRNARFGGGQVIKGTSRAKSRKNMALNTWENAR